MTDYAKVYNTDLTMAERRDALVRIDTHRGAVLDEITARDVRAVLAHMPYAAEPGVLTGSLGRVGDRVPLDTRDVLDALRGLAVVLLERGREHEATADELRLLKRDVAAHRRVLGLAPGGDLDNYGREADR